MLGEKLWIQGIAVGKLVAWVLPVFERLYVGYSISSILSSREKES